jgi:hypothetical protein
MKKILGTLAVYALPVVVLAEGSGNLSTGVGNINNLITQLRAAINNLIPFVIGIAIIYFIWGVVKYIIATGAEDKAAARGFIIYGIIGLAVIFSIYGLIALLQETFGIENVDRLDPPRV